jgi:DNA repair protein RecO (recombination protein O)
MRLVTTDALVLRTYNLAESDRIVVCLTRSVGLVRGVAKGARRMKSRFGAALEPFTVIRLSFNEKENRDLVSISNAEILKSNFNLSSGIEAAEVLAYMGELVAEFAPPHEADELLFRMVTSCVDALADSSGAERAITRYFEIWLLRLAGLFPDLRCCHSCGVVLEDRDTGFLDADLTARCRECRPLRASVLPEPALDMVRASQAMSPKRFAENYLLTEGQDDQLREVTHRLISRAIERRPRTLVASR